ncbi:MAG: hypothetical protein B7Z66_11145 [Chromatiales bacterium 21-64-14]|nr:MAG: hypothetical protein B7Z66_11145 [Chromatiales bacterium 21-64-14]HQU16783.1 EAL domain-containing protein [Gammaproteobacteria bacterium]
MIEPLTTLIDLGRRLLRVESREALDQVLVDWVLASGVDGAWSGRPDAEGHMRYCAWGGAGVAEYLRAVTIRADTGPSAEGPAGRAWRTGTIQTTADWDRSPEMAPWREAGALAGWRSTSAVPLAGPEGPVGVLLLYSHEPDRFSTHPWHQVLEHVALVAGMTLHRLNLALTDHLTGLPNRRAMEAQLEGALNRSARHKRLLAIGLLDLDDFKPVNDTYGHTMGDKVLRELAERLRDTSRSNDFVARMGGDEFLLIFEDLEDLDDLEPLLERVDARLTAPLPIDDLTVRVGASLGLVIYPLCEQDSPGELLRLADRALYQAKARKGTRTTWWSLPGEDHAPALNRQRVLPHPATESVPLYGETAARLLIPLREVLARSTEDLIRAFRDHIATNPGAAEILGKLTAVESARIEDNLAAHFRMISDPELSELRHRVAAERAGCVHCIMGVDQGWLINVYSLWLARLRSIAGSGVLRAHLALPILDQRLTADAEFQAAGYEQVARAREQVRTRIDTLAWTSERYADLIEGAVQAVVELQEVVAAAIARPNEQSIFLPEAIAGDACLRYLEAVQSGAVPPIATDPSFPGGRGIGPQSWRTHTIQRNIHFATDPDVSPWRDLALDAGVCSVASVPLSGVGGQTEAILLLFSPFPGGLNTAGQRALLEHLERTLSLGITRIEAEAGRTQVQALPERLHYRVLLRNGGLVMHYQPVVNLRTGHVVKMEALARLRHGEELIPPARFLPAFVAEDLFELFRLGLVTALDASRSWAREGLSVGVSVNLPPEGLLDRRYLEVTREALADHPLPEGCHLSLEVLETKEFARADRPLVEHIAPYRALGVEFAEDDLGTGYSNLSRLRELPFDVVKIDKSLVLPGREDPTRLLNLIGQLTALAHALGARVVVEGLADASLIEAVATLGADFGQGFGISPPLPAEDIPRWAKAHLPWVRSDPRRPRSALAVLAGFLQWQARVVLLGSDTPLTEQLAAHLSTLVAPYLEAHTLQESALARIVHQLGETARTGDLEAPDYCTHRQRFVTLLAEHIRTEASE